MFFDNTKLKKAFTLAEILIVLVVMALISTLSLRAINDSRDKQEAAVKLQKSYEDINKALANGILENGSIEYWDFSLAPEEFISTYLKTLNVVKVKKFSDILGKQVPEYYDISGAVDTNYPTMQDPSNAKAFTLMNGSQLIVMSKNSGSSSEISNPSPNYYVAKKCGEEYEADNEEEINDWLASISCGEEVNKIGNASSIDILVDINETKLPNTFGKDLFIMSILSNGTVLLPTWDDNEDLSAAISKSRNELINGSSANNYQCNSSGKGYWCGALIQKDGWKIAKDYPWKVVKTKSKGLKIRKPIIKRF